ncbi:carbohydrate kinase family protein, partial [Candidatus Peregrinibacteria bacterium]|nr:carbohydrate kinase family protein [Candidatus Peregrinibacteria bacterium]
LEDDLLGILRQKKRPGLTWNPGREQIKGGMTGAQALLAVTDILILNRNEALTFTGAKNPEEALKKLSKAGVRYVCITDGKNGTVATDGRTLYRCPVLKGVKVKDTTGAGDAFGTGLTWAILSGKNLQNGLRAGTINAASVVEAVGSQAGLLTDIEMQHRLETANLDVEEIPFTTNGQLTMDN